MNTSWTWLLSLLQNLVAVLQSLSQSGRIARVIFRRSLTAGGEVGLTLT
jgi:hypothetical protein